MSQISHESSKEKLADGITSSPDVSTTTDSLHLQLKDGNTQDILEDPDRDNEEVNRDGICATCSSIPWELLADPSKALANQIPRINHTTRALGASACYICQFLSHVIASTELKFLPSDPPYQLELCERLSVDNQNISVLRFSKARPSSVWPLGKDPHILITRNQSTHEKLPSEGLFLGGFPLGLIKSSILECESKHAESCSLGRPDTIRALKVMDCERKQVVPAPPGCRYVALSYVWGQQQINDSTVDSSTPHVLPKTVSDSCIIAQSLGYRYLWVDRYCIDQGNEQEKKEQVAQMADIYASSQLTIIAAAGDHANHGLPGIQKSSESQSNQTVVGSVQLLAHPKPFDIHKLLCSKWASRAWTFQECYFARRRLFFTEDQVTYVCNSSTTRMRSTGWIPFASRDNTEQTDEFARARRIVGGYTGRQMTYESDALAAIVSALNSLRDNNVRHLWGLPIRSVAPTQEHSNPDVELSLLWRHDEPCSRRGDLPSWSPIAWTGKITWFPPIKAHASNIHLLHNPASQTPIPWPTPSVSNDFETAPRYLSITAKMAHLGLITTSLHAGQENNPAEQQTTFLTFPLDNTTDIILAKPLWDTHPSTLHPGAHILGILLDPNTHTSRIYGPAILLVKRCRTHFERIGIMKLGAVLNYSHELLLHGFRYLRFVDRATGVVGVHDCGDLEGLDGLETRDVGVPVLERGRWEGFFVEESIVLG